MRHHDARRYGSCPVPRHIWLGVSVEDAPRAKRIAHLQGIHAPTRFVSFEPLLGPMEALNLRGIAWAIVGGESGPEARPMQAGWAVKIKRVCARDDVAFFFKQWGAARPKSGRRLLEGREWNGFPHKTSVAIGVASR